MTVNKTFVSKRNSNSTIENIWKTFDKLCVYFVFRILILTTVFWIQNRTFSKYVESVRGLPTSELSMYIVLRGVQKPNVYKVDKKNIQVGIH